MMNDISSSCMAGEIRVGPDGAIYQLIQESENFAYTGDQRWPLWIARLIGVQPGSPASQDPILVRGVGTREYQIDARSMRALIVAEIERLSALSPAFAEGVRRETILSGQTGKQQETPHAP